MELDIGMRILKQLKEPFPEAVVKFREGPYDKVKKETQYFKYIPSEHLQERLDAVLGLGWSWEILRTDTLKITKEVKQYSKDKDAEGRSIYSTVEKEVEQVIVLGKLTLLLPDGTKVFRDALGGCDVSYGVQAGDPFKIASSNAFKKACLELGIGRYIALEAEAQRPAKPSKGRVRSDGSSQQQTTGQQTTRSANPFRN